MSHPRGRAAPVGAAFARLLLALLLSGAFAACGGSSSPQVVGAAYVIGVAANREESLIALRGSDGALLWQTPIPRDSESGVASVTVTPSQVYVVSGGKPSSGDRLLIAVNAESGKVAWSFAPGPSDCWHSGHAGRCLCWDTGRAVRAAHEQWPRLFWQRAW